MVSVNKVIIVGNLARDPESRFTGTGKAVANYTVAVSESWKDKESGERKENTEWIRCVTFGKLAEICIEYLKKGAQVYCEGKLQTRKWQDKDGKDCYTTEVVVEDMKMLGSRKASEGAGTGSEGHGDTKTSPAPRKASGSDEDFSDSVPF